MEVINDVFLVAFEFTGCYLSVVESNFFCLIFNLQSRNNENLKKETRLILIFYIIVIV